MNRSAHVRTHAGCASLCAFLCALAFASAAFAHLTPTDATRRAGFDQRLSQPIPGTLPFRDENGRTVRLTDYYGSSPLVLVFAWYGCTTLCPTVIGNLAHALDGSGLPLGSYRVVVASIYPRDGPSDALRATQRYLARADAGAWHLLTGQASAIAALASSAGFRDADHDDTHQNAPPARFVVRGSPQAVATAFVRWLFCRAARFLCTSPLRAARSSRLMAADRSSAVAVGALAFLSAVRSAERCARLRTVAARDFRMFFFADAIFGTKKLSGKFGRTRDRRESPTYRRTRAKSSWDSALLSSGSPLPYARRAPPDPQGAAALAHRRCRQSSSSC